MTSIAIDKTGTSIAYAEQATITYVQESGESKSLETSIGDIRDLRFDAMSDDYLFARGFHGSLIVIDVRTMSSVLRVLEQKDYYSSLVAFDSVRDSVITADSDLRLRRHAISHQETTREIRIPNFAASIAMSIIRNVTYVADLNGIIRQIDWGSESIDDMCSIDARIEDMIVFHDGGHEQLLVTSLHGLWIADEKSVTELVPKDAQANIVCAATRFASKVAVAGTDEGNLIWIDTTDRQIMFATSMLPGGSISEVALNADASRVAIWSLEDELIISSDRDGSNRIETPTNDAVDIVMSGDSGVACVLDVHGLAKRIVIRGFTNSR